MVKAIAMKRSPTGMTIIMNSCAKSVVISVKNGCYQMDGTGIRSGRTTRLGVNEPTRLGAAERLHLLFLLNARTYRDMDG